MGPDGTAEGTQRGVMIRRRPVVIANEIRLKRSQYGGVFLVVEGRDDRLFCERFVDSGQCRIVVAEGKASVCEVLGILDQDHFSGVVGLVDSDFDRIEGQVLPSSNLVVPDLHDLECMLIRSRALDGLLIEFGSKEKLEQFGRDVCEVLVSAALPFGCLRLHSRQSKLDLKFDGISYARCVDQLSLETDRQALIHEVKNRSQRPELPLEVMLDGIQAVESEGHDSWEICSGTDLLGILSVGLRRTLGTNDANIVRDEQLRQALRLAYPDEEFAASNLNSSFRDWEGRNPPFRILRVR